MGLRSFLQQQGFIADEPLDKTKEQETTVTTTQVEPVVSPTFFPLQAGEAISPGSAAAPSFVAPIQHSTNSQLAPDPAFLKFFEDELLKANLPGPDYFEFRQQLIKTQQKMTSKGMTAPEVVIQAVLTGFETQDITAIKLVEAAKHYKQVIKQKSDDFLKGASAEKNNQLQKRQTVLEAHNDNIKKLQQQLQQLETQKIQLEESVNREKTQMEVDRSFGKEGIEKIEKAERLISQAHDYIQLSIDKDIRSLQPV